MFRRWRRWSSWGRVTPRRRTQRESSSPCALPACTSSPSPSVRLRGGVVIRISYTSSSYTSFALLFYNCLHSVHGVELLRGRSFYCGLLHGSLKCHVGKVAWTSAAARTDAGSRRGAWRRGARAWRAPAPRSCGAPATRARCTCTRATSTTTPRPRRSPRYTLVYGTNRVELGTPPCGTPYDYFNIECVWTLKASEIFVNLIYICIYANCYQ